MGYQTLKVTHKLDKYGWFMENYYIHFAKQLEKIDKEDKKKLLLHACCCPCSSHCLEVLSQHNFEITIFFYNPNIDEKEEYIKRYEELIRFTKEADFASNVKIIDGGYQPDIFFDMAKGLENLPERGKRCYLCYEMRLKKTFEYAKDNGYDYFSTTLSISPYKNAEWLNEIGKRLEEENSRSSDIKDNVKFLYSDFKKKNGYKRSIELSEEYNLYRQNYCGCIFSKQERKRKEAENKAMEGKGVGENG